MKIDLIKNHVLGKKGDTVSVSQPRGDYLIRMGVAEKYVKPKAKPKKEKENDKSGTTNKGKRKSKS